MSQGIHYYAVSEISPMPWTLQGTVYPKIEDAKYAAMKLYCATTGVRVVRAVDGWTLLFWRRTSVSA